MYKAVGYGTRRKSAYKQQRIGERFWERVFWCLSEPLLRGRTTDCGVVLQLHPAVKEWKRVVELLGRIGLMGVGGGGGGGGKQLIWGEKVNARRGGMYWFDKMGSWVANNGGANWEPINEPHISTVLRIAVEFASG